MLENLERIKQQFHEELSAVNSKENWRKSGILHGKKGLVTQELKNLRNLTPEEKKQPVCR